MIGIVRQRIGQLAGIAAGVWKHTRDWASLRAEVRNWRELWNISNPIRLVAEKRLGARSPQGDVVVRFRNGLTLAVDSSMRGDLAALLETYTGYMRNLGVVLAPGDVVIDVGAHVGAFSVPAIFNNPGIRILAFEPEPKNFRLLQENAGRNRLNGNGLSTYNLAVSNKEGELKFARGRTSTTGSVAQSGFFKAPANAEMLVVSATTVEKIFDQHSIDRCRLLKVDCEGSEYDILAGLDDGILARIENIIVEAHPARAGSPAELKALLERTGFQVVEHAHGNGCADLYCRREY